MKWKKIIGQIAPTIATALGGPIAGAATKHLSQTLLGKDDGTDKELELAIMGASPEQLLKIKQAELSFSQRMKELDIDLSRIDSEDRKNARSMAKNTNLWPQIVLSAIFILGYFGLIFFIFSGVFSVTDSLRDMSNLLIGVLTAGIPMILRFWFGGSIHDQDNLEKIHNSTPNK